MTLVLDQRASLAGKAGLHALIVGISAYPSLDDPAAAAETFGLSGLSSAAASAFRIYEWLVRRQAKLAAPLASIRLLLSPSEAELAAIPEIAEFRSSCALEAVRTAAGDWRTDAANDRTSVTFFYFAGHGVQRTRGDAVLLLEDFGDGIGGVLEKAVNTKNLSNGMAPTPRLPNVARTQFYFVDACRVGSDAFARYEQSETAELWPVELAGRDDRSAPIFYATLPGALAYGKPGKQSLFSEALLSALDGGAADVVEVDGSELWRVTSQTLSARLAEHLRRLTAGTDIDQQFRSDGMGADAVIHTLDGAPTVEIELILDPEAARAHAQVAILNEDGDPAANLPRPLTPYPFRCPLPAGVYTISADIDPPQPPFVSVRGKPRPILPPFQRRTLRVTG